MKLTPRFFLAAIAFVVAFVLGLYVVSATAGPQVALVAGLLVLSIPIALNPPSHVLGAAATADRNTEARPGEFVECDVAANTTIYLGTIVAVDAQGNAVPASDAAGLTVLGRAEETVVNTGAAGAKVIVIRRGIFLWDNSGAAALTKAHIGTIAYVADDQTVANASVNAIKAGLVVGINTDGVWIDTRYHLPVAGTVANSAVTAPKLADAVADMIRTTTVVIANSAPADGKANITGAVKDAQGNALAGRFVVALYIDDAAYGAPADLGTLTAKANSVLLSEVVDDAVALVLTHSDGTWGVELDTTVDGAVHAHAAVLGAFATANAAITGN